MMYTSMKEELWMVIKAFCIWLRWMTPADHWHRQSTLMSAVFDIAHGENGGVPNFWGYSSPFVFF